MSSPQCNNPTTCPDGNCIGCKNGQVWCQDPRCDPQCTDCVFDREADNFGYLTFFIIITVFALIIVTIVVTMGHRTLYYYVPNSQLESKGYLVPPGPAIHY